MAVADLRGQALQRLAGLAVQTQHDPAGAQSFENLYNALPSSSKAVNGDATQASLLTKAPMTAGELQVLLTLCETAPRLQSVEAANKLLQQLSPYFVEAHEQVFVPSHVLVTIEPSPWEALNFGIVSAALALAIRHPSLHGKVYSLIGQYLRQAELIVAKIPSSGSLSGSNAFSLMQGNLDVFSMSLLGFMEASALYCQFFSDDEQLDVMHKLRSMLNESFLVSVEGAFSAFRNSSAVSKNLKEKKFYLARYDAAERPLSGMLLQQSFMRFLLSSSSMQMLGVDELQQGEVLDIWLSKKQIPKALPFRGLPALTEGLAMVAADTMRILEDGSDYLELSTDEQVRLAYCVKARALTIFLNCLLVNEEMADAELLLSWLHDSILDYSQMEDETLAAVVLKAFAIMAKTSIKIAQDLTRTLPRFIVHSGIEGPTMIIAARCLSIILQQLSQDAVINGLHSLGNMLTRDPNAEKINGHLAPASRANLRISPADSSLSIALGGSDEQAQLAQVNIIRAIVTVAITCEDKKIIPLAQSILLQKLTRISSAVDVEIILNTASVVARGGEHELISLLKLYDRLSREALLKNDESLRAAIAEARISLAHEIDRKSSLFDIYSRYLMETIVRKGDIHERENTHEADVELAAREICQLLRPLSILATKFSQSGVQLDEGELAVLQREAWFNVVVHGIIPGTALFHEHAETLRTLALYSKPLVAENRIDKTESDIELNTVLRRGMSGPKHASMKEKLLQFLPRKSSDVKSLSYPQVIFFHAAYMVETLRAEAGNCAEVLHYFVDPTITQDGSLEVLRGIADQVIDLYLTKTLSRDHLTSTAPHVADQLAKIFVFCCHRIALCQQAAAQFADRIVERIPAALCQKSALFALLECMSLLWKSCLEAEYDEYGWQSTFTSGRAHLTIQLPDNFDYRKATLTSLHRRARVWVSRTIHIAPQDVKGLLQTYLADFDDEGAYGHVVLGRSFAVEMGAVVSQAEYRLRAIERQGDLAANTASDFIAQYTTRQEYKFADALPDYDEEWFRLIHAEKPAQAQPFGDGEVEDAQAVLAVLERRIAEQKFVSSSEIRDILRRAAALLTRSKQDQSALVARLVEIPFKQFTKHSIQLGVALWLGVINVNPKLESRILFEVMKNWETTVRRKVGVFNDRVPFLDPFYIKEEFAPSDRDGLRKLQERVRNTIAPHSRILSFLSSHFNAVRFSSIHLRRGFRRMIRITLKGLQTSSCHPLAREFHFHVTCLALDILVSSSDLGQSSQWRFKDTILSTALAWFSHAQRWTFGGNRLQTKAECQLMSDVIGLLQATTSIASASDKNLHSLAEKQMLLVTLLESEITRLQVWLSPLVPDQKHQFLSTPKPFTVNASSVRVAWEENPSLAIQVAIRSQQPALLSEVRSLLLSHPEKAMDEPEALQILYENGLPQDVGAQLKVSSECARLQSLSSSACTNDDQYLLYWAPVNPITAVTFFLPNYRSDPLILQYAMRAVESHSVDVVFFYVPQIVQTLRYDALGYVQRYIVETAKFSQLFAHQIIWNMKANAYKDEDATIEDQLKPTLDVVMSTMISSFSGADKDFYEREFAFFNEVTDISGKLRPYIKKEKSEKKAKIEEELRKIKVDVGVYLPSNPDGVVIDIDRKSGKPLQSHAKAPYMATFRIRKTRDELAAADGTADVEEEVTEKNRHGGSAKDNTYEVRQSAIFKVGDDCRQDVLALQMIAAFRGIFNNIGLDVFVYPYRVTATAPGCGVIDVLPNSISRDMLGREAVNGLYEYFVSKYGGENSVRFQEARSNFVKSMAAYSVISYLLQFKDRHNGNIMVDDAGHILHIDFGFCFDIAPGGVKFERAPFKLTSEMVHVMGGSANSQSFKWFEELCVKAFLAARPYAEKLCHMVMLMTDSGLPCFKPETITHFRERFVLEKNERGAADFMRFLVKRSNTHYTTKVYDEFQLLTNGIPY